MQVVKPLSRVWGTCEQRIVGARQGWKCNLCAVTLPASWHLDHRIPLWKGGSNDIETNASAICTPCHAEKTLQEERERQDALWAKRRAAVEAARAAAPPEAAKPPNRLGPMDRAFVDPLVDTNPFLRFAFIPECNRRCPRIV